LLLLLLLLLLLVFLSLLVAAYACLSLFHSVCVCVGAPLLFAVAIAFG